MFLIGGLLQVHSNPVDSCFGVYPPPEECLDHDDNRRGLITHDSAHISERSLQSVVVFEVAGDPIQDNFAPSHTMTKCSICGAFGPSYLGQKAYGFGLFSLIDDVATPDDNEYYVNTYDGSIGYMYLTSTSSLPLCPSTVTFDFSLDAYTGFGSIHTIPRTLNLEVLDASNEVILTVPVPSATIPVGGSNTVSTQVLEEQIVLEGSSFDHCTAGAKLRFAWHIPESFTGPAQFVLDNVFVEPITSSAPSSIPSDVPSNAPSSSPSFESVSHEMCGDFAVHA